MGAVAQVKVTQLENENPQSLQDALRGVMFEGLNISQVNAGSARRRNLRVEDLH